MTAPDRAFPRAVLVGVVLPVAVALVALAAQLAMASQLPDPVATHWTSGGPDGFSPVAPTIAIATLTTGLLPVVLGAVALPAIRRGERGFALRLTPATALFLAVLFAVMLTGSLATQRGLDDAADAPSVLPWVLLGLAAAVASAVLGWFLQPRHESTAQASAPAAPLPLHAGERAVWLGHAEMSRGILAVIVTALVGVGATAVAVWWAGDRATAWIVTGVTVLLAVAVAMFTVFSVRVGADGLRVRAALGWPRFTVPIDQVESVGVLEVSGLAQFGGYGIRMIPGATGVILRGGEALEVTRAGGRRLVVTVDDAATAAALLESYVEARRAAQD